jgi:hypothetical protein
LNPETRRRWPPRGELSRRALWARRVEHGWNFLTGDAAAIQQLTEAAGFRYNYDEQQDRFGHATGIILGRPRKDSPIFLRHRVFPARSASGLDRGLSPSIGSPIDQLLLFVTTTIPWPGSTAPDHQSHPVGGRRDGVGARALYLWQVARRVKPGGASREIRLASCGRTYLYFPSRLTMAPRVDAPIISGWHALFFAALICFLVVFFATSIGAVRRTNGPGPSREI